LFDTRPLQAGDTGLEAIRTRHDAGQSRTHELSIQWQPVPALVVGIPTRKQMANPCRLPGPGMPAAGLVFTGALDASIRRVTVSTTALRPTQTCGLRLRRSVSGTAGWFSGISQGGSRAGGLAPPPARSSCFRCSLRHFWNGSYGGATKCV